MLHMKWGFQMSNGKHQMRCPWCQQLVLLAKHYPLTYRHCGRSWKVDGRGFVYDPVDLRADALYNPGHDSEVIHET